MNPFGIIHEVETTRAAIAFTFDDGPDPAYTPQILDIFERYAGKATFFMVGEQMQRHPELIQQVYRIGHEIGNHTHTHPHLTRLGAEECRNELERNAALVEQFTGRPPVSFRPPYFDLDEAVSGICKDAGYRIIGALNSDARDWEQPGVEHIVNSSLKHFRNGSILLFHDGFGDRSQTVEAVRFLAAEAVARGYELVTVSELMSS